MDMVCAYLPDLMKKFKKTETCAVDPAVVIEASGSEKQVPESPYVSFAAAGVMVSRIMFLAISSWGRPKSRECETWVTS